VPAVRSRELAGSFVVKESISESAVRESAAEFTVRVASPGEESVRVKSTIPETGSVLKKGVGGYQASASAS
jgi:hypothetical protein